MSNVGLHRAALRTRAYRKIQIDESGEFHPRRALDPPGRRFSYAERHYLLVLEIWLVTVKLSYA